jgi:hypothetical protein
MMVQPTKSWFIQELSIIESAKVKFQKRIYPKDMVHINGTCLYTFNYRGDNNIDEQPLVILVGRGSSGPFFRFPSGGTAWGTYLAAINLHYISPGLKQYIIKKYGKLPYIPSSEIRKLGLFSVNYRIYHISGIHGIHPLHPDFYLMLTEGE